MSSFDIRTCATFDVYIYISPSSVLNFYFLTLQVKRFLEHVNCQLPNLSRNLFILFNHWDQVTGGDEDRGYDDDDDDDGDDDDDDDGGGGGDGDGEYNDDNDDEDDDHDHDDDDDDDDGVESSPEKVKEQHLEKVRTFFEQGLKAKAVVDRTFFVSGREAYKVQKDEKKGKQSTTGRSVVCIQSVYAPP